MFAGPGNPYTAVYIDIYENGYPVVRHIFYGKTLSEARGYEKAHMQTDTFLRDAALKGEFEGMNVRVRRFVRTFSTIPKE